MATLNITEFQYTGGSSNFGLPAPFVVNYVNQVLTIAGSSAPSAAFAATTNFIRVRTDTDCAIAFGTAPVAIGTGATTTIAMTAGATEYFSVPAGKSYKIAVILLS